LTSSAPFIKLGCTKGHVTLRHLQVPMDVAADTHAVQWAFQNSPSQ